MSFGEPCMHSHLIKDFRKEDGSALSKRLPKEAAGVLGFTKESWRSDSRSWLAACLPCFYGTVLTSSPLEGFSKNRNSPWSSRGYTLYWDTVTSGIKTPIRRPKRTCSCCLQSRSFPADYCGVGKEPCESQLFFSTWCLLDGFSLLSQGRVRPQGNICLLPQQPLRRSLPDVLSLTRLQTESEILLDSKVANLTPTNLTSCQTCTGIDLWYSLTSHLFRECQPVSIIKHDFVQFH